MWAFRRTVVHRRVVVNLTDGTALEGVLFRQDGPLLVLKDTTLHLPGAAPTHLDGDVVVERERVSFIQAP